MKSRTGHPPHSEQLTSCAHKTVTVRWLLCTINSLAADTTTIKSEERKSGESNWSGVQNEITNYTNGLDQKNSSNMISVTVFQPLEWRKQDYFLSIATLMHIRQSVITGSCTPQLIIFFCRAISINQHFWSQIVLLQKYS